MFVRTRVYFLVESLLRSKHVSFYQPATMENLLENLIPKKDKRPVNFKPDLTLKEIKNLFIPTLFLRDTLELQFNTIELLDIRRMGGAANTHLTLIEPTLVQADAANYAQFDRSKSPNRNPLASTRFKPASYGITVTNNYVISFDVETNGTCEFNLAAFAASGTSERTGKRVIDGRMNLSVVFKTIEPQHTIWVSLEQHTGGSWNLYSSRIRIPFLLFK